MRHQSAVVLGVFVCIVLGACSGPNADTSPADRAGTEGVAAASAPPQTVSEGDTRPLLQVRATGEATTSACGPSDVAVTVGLVEPALGHRYTRLLVRTSGAARCTLDGFPGIGGRGQSGDRLGFDAEQRQRTGEPEPSGQVVLRQGSEAYANLEWTGQLAGAESDRVTMLALQLARGQSGIGLPAVDAAGVPLDIGPLTTVRVGPWQAAKTRVTSAAPAKGCKVGPRRTRTGEKRFWTRDKRCYTSRWFAGAHRRMIPYGCTRAPWYEPSSRCAGGRGFHHGLDLDMKRGTRVYAGVPGRIVTDGIGTAYGNRAVIIRSRGRDILLGHLRSRAVKHGQRVRRGDLVGRSGARGAPDGPHLHFEVRPAGGSYTSAVSPRRLARLRVAR